MHGGWRLSACPQRWPQQSFDAAVHRLRLASLFGSSMDHLAA
jgi:hypothetical protein